MHAGRMSVDGPKPARVRHELRRCGGAPARSASSRRHPGLLDEHETAEVATRETSGGTTALPFGLEGWGRLRAIGALRAGVCWPAQPGWRSADSIE